MILVQGEDHLDLFCIPWNGGKHSTAALAMMSVLSGAGVEALGVGAELGLLDVRDSLWLCWDPVQL